jgi:hypothetical protein
MAQFWHELLLSSLLQSLHGNSPRLLLDGSLQLH